MDDRCVIRMLERKNEVHAGLTGGSRAMASENLWRVRMQGPPATRGQIEAVPAVDLQINNLQLDLGHLERALLATIAEVQHAFDAKYPREVETWPDEFLGHDAVAEFVQLETAPRPRVFETRRSRGGVMCATGSSG